MGERRKWRKLDEFRRAFGDSCLDDSRALSQKKHQLLNHYLTAILCENSFDDIVSKKRFCGVVGWFGPIDKSTGCRDFGSRIKDLLSQKFFHGFMTEKKAVNTLTKLWQTKRQQTYLVRFAESEIGFVLSYLDEGVVRHESITNKNGNCFVETFAEEFDSWKKAMASCKAVFKLKKHLPDPPFAYLSKKR